MAEINFDNIPEQEEKQIVKRMQSGAQDLTIIEIEEGISGTGTPYIKPTFHSNRFDVDFSTDNGGRFYLSEKALPRLRLMMEAFLGKKLTGSLDTNDLVGTTAHCIVDAVLVRKEKDGKVYNNEYPLLRYTFASATKPFSDEDVKTEDKTPPASVIEAAGILDSVTDKKDDDLPW